MPQGQLTIVFARQPGQDVKSWRQQGSYARSHAARASHARGVETRRARKQERSATEFATSLTPANAGPPTADEVVAILNPRSLLGQGRIDPFEANELRVLPDVVRRCLDMTLQVIWPSNTPGAGRAALDAQILQWRTLAVQSPLQYHSQVSAAVSLCYSLTTDPKDRRTLLSARLTHQSKGLEVVRRQITNLQGPPSNELLDCMNRLFSQGGNIYPAPPRRAYPESPMVDVLPLRLYGGFEPCVPHAKALAFLVKQRGGLEKVPQTISFAIVL
jgi:hypothetical protein